MAPVGPAPGTPGAGGGTSEARARCEPRAHRVRLVLGTCCGDVANGARARRAEYRMPLGAPGTGARRAAFSKAGTLDPSNRVRSQMNTSRRANTNSGRQYDSAKDDQK